MLDDIFWATLGLIFLTAIVSAFVRLRQRDACLKLMDDHHVTLVMAAGRAVWGDLRVHPQGLELRYAAAHRSRAGLLKTGYLLYQPEMGSLLAMCRYVGQLSPDEQAQRAKQIAATFQPNLWRRSLRTIRNIFDTLRDAFSRALSAVIGQISKRPENKALASQQKVVDSTGQELLSAVGNAYEPMLEAQIGKPVVLELKVPGAPEERVEIGGYLAEYTQHFVAVFNVEHTDGEPLALRCDAEGQVEAPPGVAMVVDAGHLTVINQALAAFYVEGLEDADGTWHRLGATLPRGCSLRVARRGATFVVRGRAVAGIDLVCPRQHATVRYASGGDQLEDVDAIAPDHEDERAAFP